MEGLPAKEWNAVLDEYFTTKKITMFNDLDWEALSDIQRVVINEVKKSYDRINKKEHE